MKKFHLRSCYGKIPKATQRQLLKIGDKRLNPLSPNSDQDQISPNNIHTLSRDKL